MTIPRMALLAASLLLATACSDSFNELQRLDWEKAAEVAEACGAMSYPTTMSDGTHFSSRHDCEQQLSETWVLLISFEQCIQAGTDPSDCP